MKKIFSYLYNSFMEDFLNFPLWIPVFLSLGIAFYFNMYDEPKEWLVNLIFGISLFVFIFINVGNSSDKIKKYKKIFAWSTLKYILKKILKFAVFIFFFPLFGHITLFILIGSWFYSLVEYSKFFKYFALLYDNSLMKGIVNGVMKLFTPIIKLLKKTIIFKFFRSVRRASHKKKNNIHSVLNLIINKTKNVYKFILKLFIKFFHNPLFLFIIFLNKKFREGIIYIKNYIVKGINLFIPSYIIDGVVNFILSLNFVLFFCIFGFFLIKIKTNMLDTHLLYKKIDNAKVIARLVEVEYFDKGYRFTLDNVDIVNYANLNLDKIRVKSPRKFGIPVIGEYIQFETDLIPPFYPDVVGGFDFARYSYYEELSASGKIFNPWAYIIVDKENSILDKLYFKFLNMRDSINKKIEDATSYDTSGVIMSMMTGERYSISKDITDAYNASGISHLLSISGIHMTLIVGAMFFLIRFLLAFCMPISSRYNTKKIATFFALIMAIFYLLLSGARLPTQRAFIMILLGLIAILIDRSPFSIRFLSLTALVILIISPQALINAGFQMSFLAVLSLIKLYELRRYWLIPIDDKHSIKGRCLSIVNILWGNILTALSTALVIAPIVIYHFNNFQIYSVIGNFFAIPICSIIVMPFILISFILMPFGLEFISLKVVEFGVSIINFIAYKIEVLPYSNLIVKSMNIEILFVIILGLLWFFIWQKRWRFFGLIPVVLGLVIYIISPVPSVFVNKFGNTFGVVDNNNLNVVNFSKYTPYFSLLNAWSRKAGGVKIDNSSSNSFNVNGVNLALVNKFKDYKNVCLSDVDILFTTFYKSKAFFKCDKPVFDKKFFRNQKGVEFYFDNGKIYYKSIAQYMGHRPWNTKNWVQDYAVPIDALTDLKFLK